MKTKTPAPVLAILLAATAALSCANQNSGDSAIVKNETTTMAGTAPDNQAEANTPAESKLFDIVALANSNEHLSTFAGLLQQTNLSAVLTTGGPYTVFIPTNEAFNNLSDEQLQEITRPDNHKKLEQLLQAHIVPGEIYSNTLAVIKELKTTDGKVLQVTTGQNGDVTIGNARIVKPNVEVSNGIVHIVDNVIMIRTKATEPDN